MTTVGQTIREMYEEKGWVYDPEEIVITLSGKGIGATILSVEPERYARFVDFDEETGVMGLPEMYTVSGRSIVWLLAYPEDNDET